MNKKLTKLGILALSIIGVMAPTLAKAAINYKIEGGSSITTLSAFLDRFINVFILEFVGIALFLSLIIGGFTYLTAGDNPQKVETAKKIMKFALIGTILASLCYIFFSIAIKIINSVFS